MFRQRPPGCGTFVCNALSGGYGEALALRLFETEDGIRYYYFVVVKGRRKLSPVVAFASLQARRVKHLRSWCLCGFVRAFRTDPRRTRLSAELVPRVESMPVFIQ